MLIAILADIHGNLPAFEAALDHVQRQRPDLLIIAGDLVVGAPDSHACWQLAQRLGCAILRGNHERYLAQFDNPESPPIWQTEQFAPVRWAFNQFSAAERTAIEHLPLHLRLPEFPDLVIVHSSLRNDRDMIAAYTPDDQLATMFPTVTERVIVRGHNHVPAVRLWGERIIITTGAVGLPLDMNPSAQYLLLKHGAGGWHIGHQSVPYDVEAAVRRFRESGYLDAAGPMARLYQREVGTACGYIVPFLRQYERWNTHESLSLDAAVQRFLLSVG